MAGRRRATRSSRSRSIWPTVPETPRRGPLIQLAPPVSSVAWSEAFLSQTLESLFVYLAPDGAHHLRPMHAESLRLGWPPDAQPGEIVATAAERYGLRPLLVHSTSWRHEGSRVILTYLGAVEPPGQLNEYLADDPVRRAELARGDAMGPPPSIDVGQVIEHAFRHLAWLVKDDRAVHDALPDWVTFLDPYEPEPFRSFGTPVP